MPAKDLSKLIEKLNHEKKNGNIAQYKPLNSILKSVAKTFNFKEKPTTKDLLALLKDI
ncbi:ABC transporter ATP-binding protein (plasmid) [Helicobacter pylori]|uniref:ABC transporter ATP-binding protein n=1 Tax=Helicobacter pylori TaxID=210 RepID=UPI001FD087D5|nr:ABC transporter ATP-binding protein [Helicobacter pylori]UOR24444.1 ABC transporter ATP-binding protein [Helicobacter pylori]